MQVNAPYKSRDRTILVLVSILSFRTLPENAQSYSAYRSQTSHRNPSSPSRIHLA
ncbi:hypothetical protein ABN584_26475 [Gloeocapsa sp. BRSZ]